MKRFLFILIILLLTPSPAYAMTLPGLLPEIFRFGGVGSAILSVVGIHIGSWILENLLDILGKVQAKNWVKILANLLSVGIVIKTAYSIINDMLKYF